MSERRICKYCGMELSEDVPHGLRQCHLHAVARIAELEAKKDILENQLREATNFLIDKNLHIDSLYEEGYKLQKRISELEAAQRWIPVSERLPEDRATVLVAFKNREILTATYYKHYEGFGGVDNYWHIEGWHSGNVTHWMPLPELPERENER